MTHVYCTRCPEEFLLSLAGLSLCVSLSVSLCISLCVRLSVSLWILTVCCESIDCVPTVTVMLVGSLFLLKTMHSVLVSFSLRAFARIHSQISDMQVCSFTIAAERASSLSSQRAYTCVSSA